jgi:hypothetical protein
MKRAAVFLGGWLALSPAFAGSFSSSAAGSASANVLRMPAGARAAALGQAYSTADGADSYFWNPAGLVGAPRSAFLSHTAGLDGAFVDFASFAFAPNPKKKGAKTSWAVGAVYGSAGAVDRMDADGNNRGRYTPNDLAAGVSWARPVGAVNAGITVKLIRSTLLDSAQTGALDAGVQWRAGDRWRLAAVLSNLGGKLKYDAVGENLPTTFRGGLSWKSSKGFLAAADAVFPRDNAPALSAGVESPAAFTDGLSLVWRAGYYSRAAGDFQGFSGYSLGFGFRGKSSFGFDYAFLPFGIAGAVHTVSLRTQF